MSEAVLRRNNVKVFGRGTQPMMFAHGFDVILVAHSVSSMTAALAAIAEPERFARLIMVGPSPRYINDTDYVGGFERSDIEELLDTMERNYIGWANFLAPVVMNTPDRPGFCSTDSTVARRFAEVTFFGDNRRNLARIPVPTLVVQCSDDLIAPASVGDYVARHIPHSRLRLLQAGSPTAGRRAARARSWRSTASGCSRSCSTC